MKIERKKEIDLKGFRIMDIQFLEDENFQYDIDSMATFHIGKNDDSFNMNSESNYAFYYGIQLIEEARKISKEYILIDRGDFIQFFLKEIIFDLIDSYNLSFSSKMI